MRTWTIILIVAVILGGIAVASSALNGGLPVEAAKVDRGPIREFVDERGKTRLPQIYNITMPYDGRIEAIDLVEGTPVYKDQAVAHILDTELKVAAAQAAVDRLEASIRENDDTSVERTGHKQTVNFVVSMDRTVDSARARVESGKAKLDYANSNLERIRKLRQSRTVTEDEYERAELAQIQASVDYQQDLLVLRAMEAMQAATTLMPTAVQQYIDRKALTRDVLEEQLKEAKVRLDEAKRDKTRGEIRSPIEGVVLERALSDERQVAAGTVLLKIGRLEDLEIEADILSQDVVNVKVGDAVEVTGPAIGPTPARGKVKRIYPAGFTKVSSLGVEQQRVKVLIDFEKDELERLRRERDLGVDYRVRVRVFTAEKDDVPIVPRSALFRGGEGQWQVFVIRDGRAELQSVETGLMNDEIVEITSGLAPGDQVILAPETTLRDGTRVRPIERKIEPSVAPHDGD